MRQQLLRTCLAAAAGLAIVGLATSPSQAYIGDWWILPIDRLDGSFTTHTGAGYDGTDAKQGTGIDGSRRVWWNTNNVYESSTGATYPSDAQLFTVDAFLPTSGPLNWHPIEAQYHGYAGDTFPIDASIPWNGAFSTNHQYIASEGPGAGTWKSTGPGPQAPVSAASNAAPGGIYMWMTGGSVLYSKWDFGFSIDRSWSMIRLTQITGENAPVIPEPASVALVGLGLAAFSGMARRRR